MGEGCEGLRHPEDWDSAARIQGVQKAWTRAQALERPQKRPNEHEGEAEAEEQPAQVLGLLCICTNAALPIVV